MIRNSESSWPTSKCNISYLKIFDLLNMWPTYRYPPWQQTCDRAPWEWPLPGITSVTIVTVPEKKNPQKTVNSSLLYIYHLFNYLQTLFNNLIYKSLRKSFIISYQLLVLNIQIFYCKRKTFHWLLIKVSYHGHV